ncbi:MAG: Na+/H+ antiporter subunit E [Candidatus Marinimicrobia bacterium]|nr:Na+/H+ antiporter subunit E [Candidatus Neomarinimicrobiota bacterium]
MCTRTAPDAASVINLEGDEDIMSRFIFTWGMLMLLWIGFTGTLDSMELVTGAGISLIIAIYAFRTFTHEGLNLFTPRKLAYIVKYLLVFLVELIKSNIDVALRVINPKMPINPEIVEFKTKLKSEMGRLILANTITLTPGTLTVDVIDNTFYIHWLNSESTDPEEARQAIAGKFEPVLQEIFE